MKLWRNVSKDFLEKRNESLRNISTPEGKILRMNHFIQVEGVFSVLKQDYAFRRFLLGGKKKVLVEFTLLAFAYNIQKLFNKTIKVINI
ncbi:MAG: transposase [Clostridium sp.]|uniref:transposase n=1 Tax=Clostridium sp. TaxID=1506 RepID=UPI002672B449|nr:transposase [Clostridium sp.]MCI7029557.1 transposase [Clostridium sp.]MDD7683144.1 transposase [Clostridium sp.]MDY2581265.1 transposase [Clostridium sp.]